MQGGEVFFKHSLPYFFKGGYLIELGAHQFDYTGWSLKPRDQPVSLTSALVQALLCGAGDRNSGPHTCVAGTLLTKPFPQSLIILK